VPDSDFHRIFEVLFQAQVRYLVVGGVAVVLHGHPRMTADLDLVLALDAANVEAATNALHLLQYQPRAPVSPMQLTDPEARRLLQSEKGMHVFSLWSPLLPVTEIDLLVDAPLPFEDMYARALHVDLGPVRISVASLPDLIAMKRIAARPRDLEDVAALEQISRILDEDLHG